MESTPTCPIVCRPVTSCSHETIRPSHSTVMREDTVRGYAQKAGFSAFEVAPVENDFWRFYLLTP